MVHRATWLLVALLALCLLWYSAHSWHARRFAALDHSLASVDWELSRLRAGYKSLHNDAIAHAGLPTVAQITLSCHNDEKESGVVKPTTMEVAIGPDDKSNTHTIALDNTKSVFYCSPVYNIDAAEYVTRGEMQRLARGCMKALEPGSRLAVSKADIFEHCSALHALIKQDMLDPLRSIHQLQSLSVSLPLIVRKKQ